MKAMILFSLLLSSSYAFAETILECKSNTNDAIYQLVIGNGDRKASISPIIADDSALSSGEANLIYMEGESSPKRRLFGGENANGNKVAVDLYIGSASYLLTSDTVVAKIYYSDENPDRMTGQAILNCSHR
jgi:hypothetical protein